MANSASSRAGPPDLSVIIVNWNTADELRRCLRSIQNAGSDEVEVIVVDNASGDGSAEIVRAEFPSVRLLVNTYNLGFAKGSNQGIEVSRGRYVMLLNPDSEVRPGAFEALVRFGDENDDIGIFGPKVLNSDGSVQYSCRRFPTLVEGIFHNAVFARLFPNNPYVRDYLMAEWDHSEIRDVDWVSGAALVIRRECLDDVGGLDERFFMYCEDVDLAYRANRRGWRVVYCPEAVIVHARGRSSDQDPNRMVAEFHKSMYKFFRKHYAAQSSIFVRAIVPVGLILRAAFIIGRNRLNYVRSKAAGAIFRRRKTNVPEAEPASGQSSGKGICDEE